AALVGFEALIRWTHPESGMVYPGSFISTAEDTGLIIPITRLPLERACRDLKQWQTRADRHLDLAVSVNISSRHFLLPTLLDDLRQVLDACELSPDRLKLEITETALMEDSEETVRLARRLRDFGIRIVIDDFGTGYSSLSYLQRLPIDTIKVDRSFVSRIHEQPGGNRNIVEAIISLAHKLNMTVVAEGIETPEQYAFLLDMKCEFGQGYLFSTPIPTPEVDTLIDRTLAFAAEHPQTPYPLTTCLSN
ncbi:MAG TPA: EAL domain-containing protein, partial [Desulfobacterales bacterium]|nr:EAL domain-containing protein [Desulfobacterales bacterium]